MPDRNTRIADELRRGIRRLVAATVALAVAQALVAGYNYRNATQAHNALCTLRGDLQRRVDTTRNYLDTHPHGFAGVSQQAISQSLRNQQRTIDSLEGLNC